MSRYRQPYSLYKRGKYYYYRTYTADGVRTVAKSTGQTSKARAQQFCDNLFKSGLLGFRSINFEEYSKHFFDDDSLYFKDRAEPLSINTIMNYRKMYRLYILPYFKRYNIEDINYSVLKAFRVSIIEKGKALSTVATVMNVTKIIITAAYRDRLIPDNPFLLLEPTKATNKERDAFTLDEVKYLYNNIGDEFKEFILLLALTGCRISEGVGIPYNNIIQADGYEYIDLQVQYNQKKVTKLKNKLNRVIPIIPEIKNLKIIEPTRVSAIYRTFEPIKNTMHDAEERLLCFHSLRHFFITSAKSYGIPEIKVEYLAGHSLKGMSKTYTNFKADDLVEILQWQKKIYEEITK